MPTASKIPAGRLSRERWLDLALEALAREGEAILNIDRLAGYLGVTKGSFYWHFRDRQDFISSLVDHWAAAYTESAARAIGRAPGAPRSRLRRLGEMIIDEHLSHFDIAVRAWAAHDHEVAAVVEKVDKRRHQVVRGLLGEAGLSGDVLAMRTRVFVTYAGLEAEMAPRRSQAARRRELYQLIDLLIG